MTIKIINNKKLTLVNNDCLIYLKTLPDNCIDLIVTDPPYYKVKKDAWDNQWETEEDFLAWLDEVFYQYYRLLKPSGSLYVFCGDRMASKTEVLISERFNVLNHIVWRKESGMHKRHCKEKLRRFAGQTERIIFAEHYGSEGFAKGNSGYFDKCQNLKATVFEPLISYFRDAKVSAGISSKSVNEATGTQMCSHWFSSSQWKLPSEEQYKQLQTLFADHGAELKKNHSELFEQAQTLNKKYTELTRDYDVLKQEYQSLRRSFSVSKEVPFTDVWDFNPVQYYEGKHPCEKPFDLINHIVTTSGRAGFVALDTFLGSGKAISKACNENGIDLIGVEMDAEIFKATLQDMTAKYD